MIATRLWISIPTSLRPSEERVFAKSNCYNSKKLWITSRRAKLLTLLMLTSSKTSLIVKELKSNTKDSWRIWKPINLMMPWLNWIKLHKEFPRMSVSSLRRLFASLWRVLPTKPDKFCKQFKITKKSRMIYIISKVSVNSTTVTLIRPRYSSDKVCLSILIIRSAEKLLKRLKRLKI